MTEMAPAIPFRDGIFESLDPAAPSLAGGRCTGCGTVYFPARRECPACFTDGSVERITLSRRGRLYSFTVIRVAPSGFTAPYPMGLVELPEGLRILAVIDGGGADGAGLFAGAPMELTLGDVGRDAKGRALVGYRFRLVNGPDAHAEVTR